MDEPPPPPDRATRGPRHGDPRISAEEMIAEALIAAGLRPPNQRLFKLNSPEAYTHLARPFPLRGIKNEQSEDFVRIVPEWVPRGVKRDY